MKRVVDDYPKVAKTLDQSGKADTMRSVKGAIARDLPGIRNRDPFFDNLKGWMRPQEVASTFGISVLTIYSWKAKSKTRKIPEGLFIKFNRQLYVRTEVLRRWISSQNGEIEL